MQNSENGGGGRRNACCVKKHKRTLVLYIVVFFPHFTRVFPLHIFFLLHPPPEFMNLSMEVEFYLIAVVVLFCLLEQLAFVSGGCTLFYRFPTGKYNKSLFSDVLHGIKKAILSVLFFWLCCHRFY
jgi:branched-subunit amino acid transport protein AzlD